MSRTIKYLQVSNILYLSAYKKSGSEPETEDKGVTTLAAGGVLTYAKLGSIYSFSTYSRLHFQYFTRFLFNSSKYLRFQFCEAQARVRQGSARDGPQGKRPQSLDPCLELTLKLQISNIHYYSTIIIICLFRHGFLHALTLN